MTDMERALVFSPMMCALGIEALKQTGKTDEEICNEANELAQQVILVLEPHSTAIAIFAIASILAVTVERTMAPAEQAAPSTALVN